MKLLVTCIHLIRHLKKYFSLENSKFISTRVNRVSSYEMLDLLPGFNFIIAGDEIRRSNCKVQIWDLK